MVRDRTWRESSIKHYLCNNHYNYYVVDSERVIPAQVTNFRNSKYFRFMKFMNLKPNGDSNPQTIRFFNNRNNTFCSTKIKIIWFVTKNYSPKIGICLVLLYQSPLGLVNTFYLTANFWLHIYWNFITWYQFQCFIVWGKWPFICKMPPNWCRLARDVITLIINVLKNYALLQILLYCYLKMVQLQ